VQRFAVNDNFHQSAPNEHHNDIPGVGELTAMAAGVLGQLDDAIQAQLFKKMVQYGAFHVIIYR
jgi:hypothetical protein